MAKHLSESLMGSSILQSLGLNARDLVTPANDRFACIVDAESLIGSYAAHGDGHLARVMTGVFTAHGVEIGSDDDNRTKKWSDIGTETDE